MGLAAKSYDYNHKYAAGDTLLFSEVISSAGGGYDAAKGVFTAPADGLYLTHLSVAGHPSSANPTQMAAIYVNDRAKATTRVTTSQPQGTLQLVLSLRKGDRVKVVTLAVRAQRWGESYFSIVRVQGSP